MAAGIDTAKIKRNIKRMLDQGASEQEIDLYVGSTGATPEMLRAAPPLSAMPTAPVEPYPQPIGPEVPMPQERLVDQGGAIAPPIYASEYPAGNLPTQPPSPLGRLNENLARGTQNVVEGVIGAAGLVPDAIAAATNAGRFGINKLLGNETSKESLTLPSQRAVEAFRGTLRATGQPVADPATMSTPERALWEAQNFASGGAAGGMALARRGLGRAAELAAPGGPRVAQTPQPLDAISAPYAQAPGQGVVRDTLAGAGAGAAIPLTQDVLPENFKAAADAREYGGGLGGVLMDMAGALVGGTAGGMAPSIGRGGSQALATLGRMATGDTDTSIPLVNGQAVSRGAADMASQIAQDAATYKDTAVGRIEQNQAELAPVLGTRLPTSGALAEDPGLVTLERRLAMDNPNPMLRADQNLNAAVRDTLDQVAPEGATAQPLADAVQQEALRRRTEAEAAGQQQVEAVRGEVDQVTGRLNEVETARRQDGAQIAPYQNDSVRARASEQLDRELIDKTYLPARTAKNQAFDAVDPEGTQKVDAKPVFDAVREVRAMVNSLGELQRAQLPGDFLSRLERLAPDIQERTTTSPILDASGNPVTRTEQVNVGGDGKMAIRDLLELKGLDLSAAEQKARQTGNFRLADQIRALGKGVSEVLDKDPAAAEARRRYAEEFAPTFRPGRGDEMAKLTREIDRDPTRSMTPPSATAGKFILPGAPERVASLRRVVDSMEDPTKANAAARDFILADMAAGGVLDKNGRVKVDVLRNWANAWGDGLDAAPGVRQEVADLVKRAQRGEQMSAKFTQELKAAEKKLRDTEIKAGRSVRDVEDQINRGALGTVLNADPDKAVAAIMESRNTAGKKLKELIDLTGKNERARDGLKAAVRDYLISKAETTASEKLPPGDRRGPVSKAKLSDIMKEHETEMAQIFSPKEMNTLRAGHKALELAGVERLRIRTGSDSIEKMQQGTVDQFLQSPIGKATDAALRIKFGMLKGGGIVATAKRYAAGMTPREANEAIAVLNQAAFDPDLMKQLLGREAPVGSPKWNSAVKNALIVGAGMRDDERPEPEELARPKVKPGEGR